MTETLWTASEIAQALGIPTQTVNTWAVRKQILQPAFVTVTHKRLWTQQQAKAIITDRRPHVARTRERRK